MVYFMKNPIKMDDLGRVPPIFGNTHLDLSYLQNLTTTILLVTAGVRKTRFFSPVLKIDVGQVHGPENVQRIFQSNQQKYGPKSSSLTKYKTT